ncbi:DUF3558 family protein [Yinghuangia sp. ASG 101]|uniref:DUF3558 family protein n=1 Tax=Yinghuangia sp. ASG 101 TaxID=2896848 RepID=UPI001E54E810|nr:DUF3558 family protein [Yinghuangia sp. ASG 101]UGQ13128.1 DUF3558 family protein [Yinghuangia sp. ASG 101]
MRIRWWGCTLAVGCMGLAAGCFASDSGGPAQGAPPTSAPATPTPPPPEPPPAGPPVGGCQLLTTDQVRDTLGAAEMTAHPEDDDRTCVFLGSDGVRVLTVRVGDLPRALLGGPEQVALLTAAPSERTEPIPDLADAAVFYSDPELGSGVAFARGRGERVTSVDISGDGPNSRSPRDTLVLLARLADASLP